MEYGPKYREEVLESVRRTVETCDSLQSFFLMHSLGKTLNPNFLHCRGTLLLTLNLNP